MALRKRAQQPMCALRPGELSVQTPPRVHIRLRRLELLAEARQLLLDAHQSLLALLALLGPRVGLRAHQLVGKLVNLLPQLVEIIAHLGERLLAHLALRLE